MCRSTTCRRCQLMQIKHSFKHLLISYQLNRKLELTQKPSGDSWKISSTLTPFLMVVANLHLSQNNLGKISKSNCKMKLINVLKKRKLPQLNSRIKKKIKQLNRNHKEKLRLNQVKIRNLKIKLQKKLNLHQPIQWN